MAYLKRISATTRYPNGFRHDPAYHGIFIHGGTSTPTWGNPAMPNRFHLTVPSETPAGETPSDLRLAGWKMREKTFQRAVRAAVEFRASNPHLAGCGIYACTDFIPESRCSGKLAIQRVA